ncbi:hypothetical protein [uncultured Cohaesibacter sp.]|uniref:hypothetical protein n=1 Tax=uncultured Cohaesibacter sp. TaxID=1002546 RepID=UPI0029C99D3C|nr:hypothetical protein [uncultured Cohaesibacter sp.]
MQKTAIPTGISATEMVLFVGDHLVIDGDFRMNEYVGTIGVDSTSTTIPKSLLVKGGAELTAYNMITIGDG